ncbi:MAG: ABC transporter ATP-binding protein [Pseudomonadota bacterium]
MDAIWRNGPGPAAAPAGLVRLSGVHKRFGNGQHRVHALHDISFELAAGEIVALFGASGDGKSTLLNIVGLLETPSEGSVVVGNLLASKLSEQARVDLRCDMIGYVFQSCNLVPVLTAHENVLLPLMLRARPGPADMAAKCALATELLGQLGLAKQAGHYPKRLDASQSQRVAIARALVTRPRLVIADEPGARLDPRAIRLMMDLFVRCQREDGTAFLISTRDQRQLVRVNRTLQLSGGRLRAPCAGSARSTNQLPR